MTVSSTDATDRDALRAMLAAYQEAARDKDREKLLALYAPDVRVFDLWDHFRQEGLEAWGSAVDAWFSAVGEYSTEVEFDDVVVEVGADLATLNAFVRYHCFASQGRTVHDMDNRFSWTLKRRAGVWQVVHEHTSVPVRGEPMQAVTRRPR